MALSNRINMRGGGVAPQQRILYEEGSWGVGYDNPGGYTYAGVSTFGATLNPSSVTLNGASGSVGCIGTTLKIDITNARLLKIRAKKTAGQVYGATVLIRTTKTLSDSNVVASISIPNANDYTEYAVDVSTLSGEYYIVLMCVTDASIQCTFDKLWLE